MKTYLYILLLALFASVACTRPDDDECIEEILERLENLESVTDELQNKKDDGLLIKEVTPITEGDGGWHVVFTDGSSVDIRNGAKGDKGDKGDKGEAGTSATPLFEVRKNTDGSTTIWINDGTGWKNTGVDLTGPQGNQGQAGTATQIEVRKNTDGSTTIWINDGTEWKNTGVDLAGPQGAPGATPTIEVKDNGDNTITLWVNGVNTGINLKGAKGDQGDPGAIGSTVQIDVRRNEDNSTTLWINDGTGWRNTGVDLTGSSGTNGVTPKLQVRHNTDNTITVWYNITKDYPDGGWVNTGEDLTGQVGAPGSGGVTPKLEVRRNPDGKITIWYNVTAGYPDGGWVNTNIDLTGPMGDAGIPGSPGFGADGISPRIDLRHNTDGTLTVWYNVTAGYPDSGWVNTGEDLTPPSAASSTVFSMINNEAEGTVTLILTDGATLTQYTFEKASTAVRFEIMTVGRVDILENTTGQIKFRVNPSTAWIPTGTGAGISEKWTLDRVGTTPKPTTRASYLNPATHFKLVSILKDGDKDGQYIATIEDLQGDPNYDYIMALVLNTNSAANPVLISSAPFTLGPVESAVLPAPPANALDGITGGGEVPTNAYTYVGAFWTSQQRGERVIKINVGADAGNAGTWTAEVAWYDSNWDPANGDGVILARGKSLDPYIYQTIPGDAEDYLIAGDTASISGTVSANGDILFRIGLTKVFTAYNPADNPARYAVVLLSYGGNARKQKLFLRQGEGDDYLMHKDDADQGGTRVRNKAAKFSPYNLTATGLDDNKDYESLATNGGVFASYPTQAGALFQFSADNYPRYAYHPTRGAGTVSPIPWEDNTTPAGWSTDLETCPAGYRRPVGGSTRTASEFAQSLMADLTTTSSDNSVWGYYADGYFDRRTIGTQDAKYIGTPDDTPSTVAMNTKGVAYIGRLFYNPVSSGTGGHYNASLFFCASGARAYDNGILYNAGTNGHYWSSSESSTDMGFCPGISNNTPAATAKMQRSLGYSVRCIKQ